VFDHFSGGDLWCISGETFDPVEEKMLAIVAAICFAVALLCDWLGTGSDFFNYQTLDTLGFLLIALHLAGFGAAYDWRGRGRAWRSRRR
jgi:hypothetical protein